MLSDRGHWHIFLLLGFNGGFGCWMGILGIGFIGFLFLGGDCDMHVPYFAHYSSFRLHLLLALFLLSCPQKTPRASQGVGSSVLNYAQFLVLW